MRRSLPCLSLVVSLALAAGARGAAADPNDLVLSRFLGPGMTDKATLFRSLSSELGTVIAPAPMTPAETLGWSGFEFSTQLGYTGINGAKPYWLALDRVDPSSGTGAPSMLPTLSVVVSKGISFPLPSLELGAGATHVLESQMYAMDAYAKFSINEGFTRFPLPAFAARFAASRLTGSSQLDLTVLSADASISKAFGIGGTWTLVPFAGWNYLIIISRSQVLDATPNVDAYQQSQMGNNSDLNNNYVFPDQSDILRQRLFFGLKAHYYKLAFIAEVQYAFAGASADSSSGTPIADQAGTQKGFFFSAALDF